MVAGGGGTILSPEDHYMAIFGLVLECILVGHDFLWLCGVYRVLVELWRIPATPPPPATVAMVAAGGSLGSALHWLSQVCLNGLRTQVYCYQPVSLKFVVYYPVFRRSQPPPATVTMVVALYDVNMCYSDLVLID